MAQLPTSSSSSNSPVSRPEQSGAPALILPSLPPVPLVGAPLAVPNRAEAKVLKRRDRLVLLESWRPVLRGKKMSPEYDSEKLILHDVIISLDVLRKIWTRWTAVVASICATHSAEEPAERLLDLVDGWEKVGDKRKRKGEKSAFGWQEIRVIPGLAFGHDLKLKPCSRISKVMGSEKYVFSLTELVKAADLPLAKEWFSLLIALGRDVSCIWQDVIEIITFVCDHNIFNLSADAKMRSHTLGLILKDTLMGIMCRLGAIKSSVSTRLILE